MNKKLKAMMYKLTDTRKEKSMLPANVVEMFEKHAKRVSEFFKPDFQGGGIGRNYGDLRLICTNSIKIAFPFHSGSNINFIISKRIALN